MSTTTPYLNLTLYDSTSDQSTFFSTFRAVWGGTATTSNFYRIDTGVSALNSRLTTAETTKGNPQEGMLYNAIIQPSVASSNLTVALKTYAGADPSPSDPAYIILGGAPRTITAALSVTLAAATNWMNLGSNLFATVEQQLFVYLGYNGTDGVTIGVSRIPYAKKYSQFNTTNTDERFAAISNITSASSNDPYYVIGRFSATLSGGSGYTWTVPTFTPQNLLQYHILETGWMNFNLVIGALGSMTWSTTSTKNHTYKISNDTLYVVGAAQGTLGGTRDKALYITSPFTFGSQFSNAFNFACTTVDDTDLEISGFGLASSNLFYVYKYDRSVMNATTGYIDINAVCGLI